MRVKDRARARARERLAVACFGIFQKRLAGLNAFLATADPEALQAAADRLSAIIRKRLDYWTFLVADAPLNEPPEPEPEPAPAPGFCR